MWVTPHTLQRVQCSYKNKDIMENDAQTGEYCQWHSRLKMCIPVFFLLLLFFLFKTHLVHIWAGLGLGWFWNTDQSREVWTWIKTLFVPVPVCTITKWILMLFVHWGSGIYVQQPVGRWTGGSLSWLCTSRPSEPATGRWRTSPSRHWRWRWWWCWSYWPLVSRRWWSHRSFHLVGL